MPMFSTVDPIVLAVAFLAAINLVSFLVFALDKHRARQGRWRVRERRLLLLAAFGGSIGIMAGQQMLRHKTRKQPFRAYLAVIVVAQIVLVAAVLVPPVRDMVGVVFDAMGGAAAQWLH